MEGRSGSVIRVAKQHNSIIDAPRPLIIVDAQYYRGHLQAQFVARSDFSALRSYSSCAEPGTSSWLLRPESEKRELHMAHGNCSGQS